MVLSLTEADVMQMFDMTAGLRVVEESFEEHANGNALLIPRISQTLDGGVLFRIMPAALPATKWFGLKTLTGYPGGRRAGETYFTLLLFEAETGALRALIASTHLTGIRTGATSGVAARYLANENAETLGIIGTGSQARYQLMAMLAVRPIKRVKIFSPQPDKAAAFAQWASLTFGVETVTVAEPRQAVTGSQIVVAATTATAPVVLGDWLEPGTFVSAIGANTPKKREVDARTFERSTTVVDFKNQVVEEAGDLRDAINAGAISASDLIELGDVICGRKVSADPPGITLFKSVGTAIQDLASAAYVYKEAVARGLGTSLRLESGDEPADGIGHVAAAPNSYARKR